MTVFSNMGQSKLLEQVIEALTSNSSPETKIERALTLLDPYRGVKGARKKEARPMGRKPVLIGESPSMQALQIAIQRIASTPSTVLIRGESGTGKELVARSIHVASSRVRQPFVVAHCAAVPEHLIESMLFGHERGAFTGAHQRRKGRIEQAAGGTLFLDEVGDIPLSTQVKLLRVLQEKEYEPVGGNHPLPTDVRVVAATHRNLEAMVQSGEFREDLYYRLNVVPLVLPPLRDRQEDVPLLIHHFLTKCNREPGREVVLAPEFINLLKGYHWPGNVRELQNCVERLVALTEHTIVDLDSIPDSLFSYFNHMRTLSFSPRSERNPSSYQTLPDSLDAIERDRLREALTKAGWVKAKAARLLGMTTRQISYRIQKYQLTEKS